MTNGCHIALFGPGNISALIFIIILVVVRLSSNTATSQYTAHAVCGLLLAVARRWMTNSDIGWHTQPPPHVSYYYYTVRNRNLMTTCIQWLQLYPKHAQIHSTCNNLWYWSAVLYKSVWTQAKLFPSLCIGVKYNNYTVQGTISFSYKSLHEILPCMYSTFTEVTNLVSQAISYLYMKGWEP